MIQVGQRYQQDIGAFEVLNVEEHRCFVRWDDGSSGWLTRLQGWFAQYRLIGQVESEPSVCDIF